MVKIVANGNEISILKSDSDYISLTDIAKYQDEENPRYIIQNWMRNKKYNRVPWNLGKLK